MKTIVIKYLLLVTFMAQTAGEFTPQMGAAAASTPYDGLAVMYLRAYDTSVPNQAEARRQYAEMGKMTGKQVWPWVFWNRIIGRPENEADKKLDGMRREQLRHFGRIEGMDIYNKTGDLAAFKSIWRGALQTAKETGAPGIVFDTEAYNNYKVNKINRLATMMSRDYEEVKARLAELGGELADDAAAIYPEAVIFSLCTGLTAKRWNGILHGNDLVPAGYLFTGFLDRCAQKDYRLTLISGGQSGINYCSRNLVHLEEKIANRELAYQKLLLRYRQLKLAAPITLWADKEGKKGWLTKGDCGHSQAGKVKEMEPQLQVLMKNYNFVWIYAAGVSDYRPFEKTGKSQKVHEAIQRAKAKLQ